MFTLPIWSNSGRGVAQRFCVVYYLSFDQRSRAERKQKERFGMFRVSVHIYTVYNNNNIVYI